MTSNNRIGRRENHQVPIPYRVSARSAYAER